MRMKGTIAFHPNGEITCAGYLVKEVMQLTGLHDKNGNEIYEGDIVMASVGFGLTKLEVKWFPQGCWYPFNHTTGKNTEVIGNIYENPELLNTPPTSNLA